ncbi:MAG: AI-2E family transporter YdiK [Geobacteraceae bacterium]|nr:MAG: AI-2E family transporter YdiK [Geobacteraceae bacterium]
MTSIFQDRDLVRTMMAVLLIGILIAACLWIIRPFFPAIVWATMVVVATWPIMIGIQKRLWGKRALAVILMTTAFFLLIIVPFTLFIVVIIESTDEIIGWTKSFTNLTMPPPPNWLKNLPIVGDRLEGAWLSVSSMQAGGLAERIAPYLRDIILWFVKQVGGGALMFVQLLLTIAITAILYSNGEKAAIRMNRFASRIAGQRGEEAVALAARAVRAVALGVIVTAIIQSFLAGIGLSVAGIPYVTLLTAIIFLLVVAQVGLAPVMVPAVIWLYWTGKPGMGTVLLIWTIVVGAMDNFLKPILIKRSANISLVTVFVGVIGGLIAFGVIGIFIGPALLAVSSTLLTVWMDEYEGEKTEDSVKVSEEITGNESPAINSLVPDSNGKASIPGV